MGLENKAKRWARKHGLDPASYWARMEASILARADKHGRLNKDAGEFTARDRRDMRRHPEEWEEKSLVKALGAEGKALAEAVRQEEAETNPREEESEGDLDSEDVEDEDDEGLNEDWGEEDDENE